MAGAVSRSAAGRDAGEAAGIAALGITVSATIEEALREPSDVVIDYTKPHVVKDHALTALRLGRHVVVGTSGLGADDYAEIDKAAIAAGCGVLAAGNFSITATLMRRFALEAARYVPDVEIIDYAPAQKADTPSGTARELAEMLGEIRQRRPRNPSRTCRHPRNTGGGSARAGQVHSLRMPSFCSCDRDRADNERLVIRHDAGVGCPLRCRHAACRPKSARRFVGSKPCHAHALME